ncbi:MAG: hypothetical protein KAI94_07145, partial [Anaerolineales bacterium]|nr:hypothetical protein [Anaerolineales bacterium]
VTFLFTDIEGSTQLLSRLCDQYATSLADQRRILRKTKNNREGRYPPYRGNLFAWQHLALSIGYPFH